MYIIKYILLSELLPSKYLLCHLTNNFIKISSVSQKLAMISPHTCAIKKGNKIENMFGSYIGSSYRAMSYAHC